MTDRIFVRRPRIIKRKLYTPHCLMCGRDADPIELKVILASRGRLRCEVCRGTLSYENAHDEHTYADTNFQDENALNLVHLGRTPIWLAALKEQERKELISVSA